MTERPPAHLLSGQEWHRNPFPAFAELRRDWPVARVDWPQAGAGEWLLTRFADVYRTLAAPNFSFLGDNANPGPPPRRHLSAADAAKREPMAGTMFLTDPPGHSRMRTPVSGAFTPKRISKMRPRIESMVETLIEKLPRQGHFDLIENFASPLPAMAIAEIVGVPLEDLRQLQIWVDVFVTRGPLYGCGPVGREVVEATENLVRYMTGLVAKRRLEPQDDLLSVLIATAGGTDPFTERELVTSGVMLMAAGMETTRHLIGNGMVALIEDPEALEQLAGNLDQMPLAVEELVRFDSPIQFVSRIATEDFDVSGVVIPKGGSVRLALGAANRDPEQFEDPDTLNLLRQPNRHVGFAHGAHFCPGSHLARLMGGAGFTALLERFRGFALVPGGSVRAPNPTMHGYKKLKSASIHASDDSRPPVEGWNQ